LIKIEVFNSRKFSDLRKALFPQKSLFPIILKLNTFHEIVLVIKPLSSGKFEKSIKLVTKKYSNN